MEEDFEMERDIDIIDNTHEINDDRFDNADEF